MKIAPVTVTQMAVLGGVVVVGYLAYKAYSGLSSLTVAGVTGAISDVAQAGVTATANAVDTRKPAQNPNDLSLGGIQQAVSNAVQRGQDAGATNFLSAYLKGIFS